MTSSELTGDDVRALRKDFLADPAYKVAQNAVTQTSIKDIALDREVVTSIDPTVSNLLDHWKVTNQKKSGRCWLFAGLNLLRVGVMAELGTDDFEFSQNHIMFWDKLERCNYFLESVAQTADRPTDDRTVAWVLENVMGDGGQWNMFAALVEKHGVVPKHVMPETESSSSTAVMNSNLRAMLRQAAREIRLAADASEVAQIREQTMRTAYRMLAIHLGTPPESFTWQWTDSDRVFHRDGVLTPQEFAKKYVTLDLQEYVCLVDDPRAGSPRASVFTVDQLGNILGGAPVRYLNVEPEVLADAAVAAIKAGEPVWFGCDVGKQMQRDLGIWDAKLFDYGAVYDTAFSLDKAARLEYHETLMTHAMLFTGVDLDDEGRPLKWRVENSWGDEHADKGFYTMNHSWFLEHVFEIAAPASRLPAELVAALTSEPIVLPAWDPMGALAN